jgi:hypothetical protein
MLHDGPATTVVVVGVVVGARIVLQRGFKARSARRDRG